MNTAISPELVSAYSETVISIQINDFDYLVVEPTELQTDSTGLRRALGNRVTALWVITAENPYSNQLSAEENSERQLLLFKELSQLHYEVFDALCTSQDGSWSEYSYAVEASEETTAQTHKDIHKLAQMFGQNAVFKITPESLSVLSTLTDYVSEKPTVLHESFYKSEF